MVGDGDKSIVQSINLVLDQIFALTSPQVQRPILKWAPDEFAACKGASPFIVQAFHEEDSLEGQMFVMADKTTFLELGSPDAATAVLLLMPLLYLFILE